MLPSFTTLRRFSLCLCIGTLMTGCELNSNGTAIADPPHCTITSASDLVPESPGKFAKMNFIITSDGEGTAYSIVLNAKLKRGNLIVSERSTVISSLKPGEAIAEELWFPEVKSAADFDSFEPSLTWRDYDNGVYP
jgi:hypothetical protein